MSLNEHQHDEDGYHDEDACELCIEREHTIACDCRCGNCCEGLIIEATVRDGEREPRIPERCGPMYDELPGEPRQLIGYLLNDLKNNHGACAFFDRQSRQCTIHETRPIGCRVFDCNEYERREPTP